MSSLAELQQRVQHAVLAGEGACVIPGEVLATGTGRGFEVYRAAYRARLREALGSVFEHTWAYLGDTRFAALCARYIEATPSSSANLRDYGRSLPEMVLVCLPEDAEAAELATMDWNLHVAFDALDAPLLAPQSLAALTEDDWARARLRFQPSVSLARFEWNTREIWHAIDKDELPPPPVLLAEPVAHLFWRKGERPHFRSLETGEYAMLCGLVAGQPFARCCDELVRRDPAAADRPGGWLACWLQDGILTAVEC